MSKLFVNSSATDIVFVTVQAQQLKQNLRSAQVAGQWREDTALTLQLFWLRSTVSPVFFGRYPRSSLHSFVPFPLAQSLISHLASARLRNRADSTSARFRFGSPFSSKRLWLVDSLVTLSTTFYSNIEMALVASHLNTGVILVVTM